MSEESNFGLLKFTLAKFGVQLVGSELLQYQSKMLLVFFIRLREYENIIDEDYHKFIQVFCDTPSVTVAAIVPGQ
jgi:hypothetical protein